MEKLVKWFGIELDEVSAREKAVSALGGVVSLLILTVLTKSVLGLDGASMMIASMGASAVLLFAVPHGQLSQPWPVLGGHVVSALIGVTAWKVVGSVELAAALAVGLAIGAMHLLRCIHPPGGATALTAVIGGAGVHSLGYDFVLRPVLLNAVVMVGLAVVFNAPFAWRRYPVGSAKKGFTVAATGPSHDDVLAALRSLDTFVDVDEADLLRLVELLSESRERPRPAAPGGD